MSLPRSYRIRRPGFTLIELLLVISIIAVLSALGLSIMGSAERDALETRTQAGIERISNVLNRKFEAMQYRILPARLPMNAPFIGAGQATQPWHVQQFHKELLNEFLRVEFPFLKVQVEQRASASISFPQNFGTLDQPDYYALLDSSGLPNPNGAPAGINVPNNGSLVSKNLLDPANPVMSPFRPQISNRYFAKVVNSVKDSSGSKSQNFDDWTIEFEDAECLYLILSLNFDEFGQPLSAVLREREIGDTDGDGMFEVLDAFGDPLKYRIGDTDGNEVILSQSQDLDGAKVRGPLPIEDYRIWIRSINVPTRGGSAVVTQ